MQPDQSSGDQHLRARFGLHGKTAFVTGGTKAIGKAIVEELASLGAKVLTCSRTGAEVDRVCAEWQERGLNVQGFAADLTDLDSLDKIVSKVKDFCSGKLDILVNNAGRNIIKLTNDMTRDDFGKMTVLNQEAVFFLTQKCYPLLEASGNSSVVMIGSVAGGPKSSISGAPYCMNKAAIDILGKVLAHEWAPVGVRCNVIKPGVVETELTKDELANPSTLRMVKVNTPLRRLGLPQEIAGAVAFLSTPAASFITGQCLSVDGGYESTGFWPFEDVIPYQA